MTRGENGWRTAKAPTLSKKVELPERAMMKLVIDGVNREFAARQEYERGAHCNKKDRREAFGERVCQILDDMERLEFLTKYHIEERERHHSRVIKALDERGQRQREEAERFAYGPLKEALGLPHDTSNHDVHAMVRAVITHIDIDKKQRHQIRALDDAENAINVLRKTLELPDAEEIRRKGYPRW